MLVHIKGSPLEELEKRFKDFDIGRVERHAIRNMAAYLNGECVLERWCRENGLVSKGNIYVPDYLPDEIQQYVKDICLKHCMLEECPE